MPDANGRQLPDADSELPPGDEPILIWATIVKSKTDDDMFEVDTQYVNSRVCIDLRTARFGTMYNKKHKMYHGRELINIVSPTETWIPTELLDIEFDR